MRVFAYAAKQFEEATRRAAGVDPLCCPPLTANSFDVGQLEGNDLIFLSLHALPGVPALLGTEDGPPVALKAAQLESVDLGGAVVFAATCYLGDKDHPMRLALQESGAGAVVAGDMKNYEPGYDDGNLRGALLLGLWLRRGMEWGLGVTNALRLAKTRMIPKTITGNAARDALAFKIFRS